jgi:hypothetical protein
MSMAVQVAVDAISVLPVADAARHRERQSRSRAGWMLRWPATCAVVCLLLLVGGLAALGVRRYMRVTLPGVPNVDVYSAFVDATPVNLTFAAGEQAIHWATTADDLRYNVTLWRRMQLADWNGVSEALRARSLRNMFRRYSHVLMNPTAWDATVRDGTQYSSTGARTSSVGRRPDVWPQTSVGFSCAPSGTTPVSR